MGFDFIEAVGSTDVWNRVPHVEVYWNTAALGDMNRN
jgi:hypothetical protein